MRNLGRKIAYAALLAAVAVSCADTKPSPINEKGEVVAAQAELSTAELKIGDDVIVAELARTAEERRIGLMFRERLDDGRGMLFIFEKDLHLNFWMENTRLPLSIAYIDSSFVIRDILDMTPFSRESVPSSVSVRYALEVPQGYFGRAGISVGDTVEIPEPARKP
jgi:hypothetical protein